MTQEKAIFYWLIHIPGFGGKTIWRLLERFGNCTNILNNIEETRSAPDGGLNEYQRQQFIIWKKRLSEYRERYCALEGRGIRFVTCQESDYPRRLLEIWNPPAALFVRGRLPREDALSVAVVGARNCTSYGRQIAGEFACMLAEAGIQVISGLAAGIDGAAHAGALNAGASTFGVLGCGVNICYPPAHYRLFEAMLLNGGILSEYPLGQRPNPGNFPMRNRIISGLSDGILVVEAKEKSGSLITAELGLDQGKDIFAVPGRVTDPLSRGCNWLIKEGAVPAISPKTILEHLGIDCEKKVEFSEKDVNRLAKKEKMVYSCLDLMPKHLDEIAEAAGFETGECLGILLGLEMAGFVIQTSNHFYGKNIRE